jgi:hypothetical protein
VVHGWLTLRRGWSHLLLPTQSSGSGFQSGHSCGGTTRDLRELPKKEEPSCIERCGMMGDADWGAVIDWTEREPGAPNLGQQKENSYPSEGRGEQPSGLVPHQRVQGAT